MNNDSILTSVKKMLGITEEYEQFDADIIIHINSVFSVLNQVGVGPKVPFSISDKTSEWSDFDSGSAEKSLVKSYVFLKVKLLFDPPASSTILENYKAQASEIEWRMHVCSMTT